MTEARLVLLGVNHRTASIGLRERLAFTDAELPLGLQQLRSVADEIYLLSTCNRTEVYAVGADPHLPRELAGLLVSNREAVESDLPDHCYVYEEEDAVRHLLSVASGLDSMVLGEAQILGQVRHAYEAARTAGTVGRVMGRVLPLSLEVGKRARTETSIGMGAVSISSVASELARQALGSLEGRAALVVGAGKASQIALLSLREEGIAEVLVANRTYDRAVETATAIQGRPIRFETLDDALAEVDIVLSCTDASRPVITAAQVEQAMARRAGRELLLVDIAVPRDIEPSVAGIPSVYLFNVDDLEAVSNTHLEGRTRAVEGVEAIVDEGLEKYRTWRRNQVVTPTIEALYHRAEGIRRAEVERTLRRLTSLDEDQRAQIDVMTSAIVRRLLHDPVTSLKSREESVEAANLAAQLRTLFHLDDAE